MVLQEFIRWDSYIRCMGIGQEHVLVMNYDPNTRRYTHHDLSAEMYERIVVIVSRFVVALVTT
jgi:hypothetical protein